MAEFNITSQEAIAEIRLLIAELENLKKSTVNVNKANAESFERLESSLKKMKEKVGLLTNQMNYLKSILNSNTGATNQNTASTNANANSTNKNAANKNKQAAATNKATNSTNKNTKATAQNALATAKLDTNLLSIIRTLGLIAGIGTVLQIANEVYDTIKTFDSLNFALEKITQTTLNYENSQKFLLTLSEKFGIELVSTTNRWLKFLAAAEQTGLSLRETENIFRSVTKASAVLGLKTDELAGVYLALEQMLSKGKVTTEELRRQLGERLPGAFPIMAAAIGVTTAELDKMLKKGEVLSAEVLPKFARALEQAYGIETQETIENLISQQGRLTAAWQLFIKTVTEGDSVLKNVIGGTLLALTNAIRGFTFIAEDDGQEIRRRAAEMEETFRLEDANEKRLMALKEKGFKSLTELDEKLSAAKIAMNRAAGDEEKKVAEENLAAITKIALEVSKRAEELQVKDAAKDVALARDTYEKKLKLYTEYQENLNKPLPGRDGLFETNDERDARVKRDNLQDPNLIKNTDFDELKSQLILYEAIYNFKRKMAETSTGVVISNEEKVKVMQVLKDLKEIKDLSYEIAMGILEGNIQLNEELIESDRIGGSERANLYAENVKYRNRIAELGYEKELEVARIYRDKEIEQALAYDKKVQSSDKFTQADKIKSAERTGQYVLDITAEYSQKQTLAEQKKDQKIFDNAEKGQADILKLLAESNARRLEIVQDPFNEEIIRLKEVYNASKKTAKDQEDLERGLAQVAIDSANAIIDAKISILRASIAVSVQSQEEIDAIVRKIKELEAGKLITPPDNVKDWKKYFSDILDYARDFNNALGDLFDAIHERKIEYINAEIDAETKKYDKLIALSEGDDEQQKTLEVNKEIRIRQLEEKRLKQEQKQAKARKAFAIAGIAIDTASAILRIWGNSPDPTGISQGILTAIVSAIGAVQIAAVLATPIPQYAEGGKITKNEIAMINDANAQEYVQRGNSILTTKIKNSIVNLKKGDIVHKNYDSMRENMFSIQSIKTSNFSEDDFNKLGETVCNGLEKGFKRIKVNPNIKVNNNIKNNDYKKSLSRWN